MSEFKTYKVTGRVIIDIETEYEMAHDDPDPPTEVDLKFCIDEDINDGKDIAGAIGDCKVIAFSWELLEAEGREE